MSATAAADVVWGWQHLASVPPGDRWLTPAERHQEQRFVIPKRHDEWRLGRWTAKQVIAGWLRRQGRPACPNDIAVVARSHDDGFPVVTVPEGPAPSISISHRDAMAVCLVGRPDVVVGCDLERVESRPVGFAADWFTAAEQQEVAAARADRRDEVVTAIWSAKESALKAIGEGLRLDTRTVEVDVGRCRDGGAAFGRPCPIEVAATGGSSAGRAGARRSFAGWMRRTGPHVLVLLAEGGLLRHAPPGRVLGEPAASPPSGDGGLAVGMELVR